MRKSIWKQLGAAAPVFGTLAAFGVLASQAVTGGPGDASLPVHSGMSVAVARGVEPISTPTTANAGASLAVDMNSWQETAAVNQGQRGSRKRF